MGSVYQDLGDFEQAKEYHHHALNIYLKKLEPEHVRIATTYSDLVSVYERLGNTGQANRCREHALIIPRKKLGAKVVDDPAALVSLVSVQHASVDLQQPTESNNHSQDFGQKQHLRVRSKLCIML